MNNNNYNIPIAPNGDIIGRKAHGVVSFKHFMHCNSTVITFTTGENFLGLEGFSAVNFFGYEVH